MTDNTPTPSSHQPDDEHAQKKMLEAPDVPEGGIPNLTGDDDEAHDPSSSAAAEREQSRQIESGEENAT